MPAQQGQSTPTLVGGATRLWSLRHPLSRDVKIAVSAGHARATVQTRWSLIGAGTGPPGGLVLIEKRKPHC